MAEVVYSATGRRKSSVARVRLVPGEGKVVINGREMNDYFGLETLKLIRPTLKKAGLMTRDPREKERRKYGLKKARKASQYSKR